VILECINNEPIVAEQPASRQLSDTEHIVSTFLLDHRPVQGLIGTAEIAFIGEPSSTRLLIAT